MLVLRDVPADVGSSILIVVDEDKVVGSDVVGSDVVVSHTRVAHSQMATGIVEHSCRKRQFQERRPFGTDQTVRFQRRIILQVTEIES